MKIALLIILLILSGCGISPYMEDTPPPGYQEVRCTYIDGQGRYGLPLTNYVKGAVKMAKLTIFGEMRGVVASCNSGNDGSVSVKMVDDEYATDAVPD